jgi:hypothetical protein
MSPSYTIERHSTLNLRALNYPNSLFRQTLATSLRTTTLSITHSPFHNSISIPINIRFSAGLRNMLSLQSLLLAMLAMAPLFAHAHLILKSPVPFGVQTKDPLKPGEFPTKGIALTVNTMNEWTVGSKQELSFHGTAVHGGGSCQISLTTDKAPTKDSKFKVIHSFEGGCPASVPGNYPDNLVDPAPPLSFEVPAEVPAGEYVGAWSWSNKVGNREFYMALYPVTVTGGSADAATFDALPDIAVANINDVGGTCETEPMKDYKYPNPGKYVTSGGTGPFADLCSGGGSLAASVGGPSGGGSGGDIQSPAAPASSQAPAAPVLSASSQAPATSSSAYVVPSTLSIVGTVTAALPSPTGGVFAPSASSAAPTVTPSVSLGPTPIASASASASVSAAPSASAAPAPGNGTTCSPDGSTVCSPDGTQFGICNFGKAVMVSVAQGTKCTNGTIGRRGDYSHRNQHTAV